MDNIKEMFKLFQSHLDVNSATNWPNKETTQFELNNYLENARLVDKAVLKLKYNNTWSDFYDLFEKWQHAKGLSIERGAMAVLSNAMDSLISKLLISSCQYELVEFALDDYLSSYGDKRLKKLLSDTLFKTVTNNIIIQHASQSSSLQFNKEMIKHELLLTKWSEDVSNLELHVMKTLTDCYNFWHLEFITKILIDRNVSKDVCHAVEVGFTKKLAERDKRNSALWYDLLVRHNKTNLCKLSELNKNIFREMADFLLVFSLTMSKECSGVEIVWVNNKLKSFCPNLTFFDVIDFVKYVVYQSLKLKELFLEWTSNLRSSNSTIDTFWDHVLNNVD